MEGESSGLDENRRQSSVSFKENENKESLIEPTSPTPKVPKKFINNWRQACDRTKDRTKELLKKWRTLPEAGHVDNSFGSQSSEGGTTGNNTRWSEQAWTEWIKKSMEEEEEEVENPLERIKMTEIQKKKFEHFFICYLDLDRDDVISLTDFDALSERIRHFSNWSKNSTQYYRLKEVQRGFIEKFLLPVDMDCQIYSYDLLEKKLKKEQLSLERWLEKWTVILSENQNFYQLPLWLQYFPKLLFQAVNKSGTGVITKEELANFFSSILGLTSSQISPFASEAYDAMTSSDHHLLTYSAYRLCFANFVFARYPNGPGQYLFGPISGIENISFPIDYKTFNCDPQELEQYSLKKKSNRTSVIV